jgi:hypothetical protein
MIVLVIGPGRCGSSTTARLLHENCNINMGEKWVREPDSHNPNGYYEDYAFGEIIKNLMTPRVNSEEAINQVIDFFKTVIAERSAKYTNWGFKANTLYTALPILVPLLPEPPHIIRCRRPLHPTVLSWVKVFRTSFRQCLVEILLREHTMDMLSSQYDFKDIWFDGHRTDESVLVELTTKIPGLSFDDMWGFR